MIILLLWLGAVGGVTLGLKSFSRGGLPLLGNVYITGIPSKVIGIVCFIVGVASMLVFIFMFRPH